MYQKHKKAKRRAHDNQVNQIEHGSFSPLLFSTTGGMGQAATTVDLQENGRNDHRQEETRLWLNPDVAEMLAELLPPQSLDHVPLRHKIKECLHQPEECPLAVVLRAGWQ